MLKTKLLISLGAAISLGAQSTLLAANPGGFHGLEWGTPLAIAQKKSLAGSVDPAYPSHLLRWLKEDMPELWTNTVPNVEWILFLGSFIKGAPAADGPEDGLYCFMDGNYFAYVGRLSTNELDDGIAVLRKKYGEPSKKYKNKKQMDGYKRTDLVDVFLTPETAVLLFRSCIIPDKNISLSQQAKYWYEIKRRGNKFVHEAAVVAYDREKVEGFQSLLMKKINEVASEARSNKAEKESLRKKNIEKKF